MQNVTLKIGAKAGTYRKNIRLGKCHSDCRCHPAAINYEIDRKKIHVDGDSIKELGTYTAKINLHKEVKLEIKFEVVAE